MSGIVVEPGFDTKITQFTPIRNAPVWRRAVRKYHCLEDVNGTSNFKQLSFKIHCQEKNLVCNDARVVFPLRLVAYAGDPDSGHAPGMMSMAAADAQTACNIAVAQNAPWNAFETITTVVNTKVYTEKPRSYGRMLGQTYQSVSEMQFMNNHSLKPISNTNLKGSGQIHQRYMVVNHHDVDTGHTVVVRGQNFSDSAFVLERANSGFLERSRLFQQNLTASGKAWVGEISSLLNTGPFSAEARGEGNDQLPYIEDLFLSLIFKQTKCQVDATLMPSRGPDYRKVVIQSLFEFLTPSTATFFRENGTVMRGLDFPQFFGLEWTGKPYVQIEWIKYDPAAMLPMYRLQGFQYKLTKSNEFSMPLAASMNSRHTNAVTARVSTQCLSVPNKLYIWAEPTETSVRDSFLWGGMFRTCEIQNNSLMVRVNGESHIIDRPDSQSMLFKWWKRHSNSVMEYPTWAQNQVIILTPNEIGKNDWLENDAVLSTIEISCNIQHSRLQYLEYGAAEEESILVQSGVKDSHHTSQSQNRLNYTTSANPLIPRLSDLWNQRTSTGFENTMNISLGQGSAAILRDETSPIVPQNKSEMQAVLSQYSCQLTEDGVERFRVGSCDRAFNQLRNSLWVKYNTVSKEFVSRMWFVELSDLFEFTEDNTLGVQFVPWFYIAGWDQYQKPEIRIDTNTQEGYDLSGYAMQGSVYQIGANQELTEPKSWFNYPVTVPSENFPDFQFGALPSHQACQVFTESLGVLIDMGAAIDGESYFTDEGAPVTDVDKYTSIYGTEHYDAHDVIWLCMAPQVAGDTEIHYYTTTAGVRSTELTGFYHCQVQRGFQDTRISDVSYDISDGKEDNLILRQVNHATNLNSTFRYELNVLAEYNNQQIVMDNRRRIAVRVENNVPVER